MPIFNDETLYLVKKKMLTPFKIESQGQLVSVYLKLNLDRSRDLMYDTKNLTTNRVCSIFECHYSNNFNCSKEIDTLSTCPHTLTIGVLKFFRHKREVRSLFINLYNKKNGTFL